MYMIMSSMMLLDHKIHNRRSVNQIKYCMQQRGVNDGCELAPNGLLHASLVISILCHLRRAVKSVCDESAYSSDSPATRDYRNVF